ncbi:MAG: hypothetical protein A4E25_01900 [Methanobacterium sp. PtaB.Bin024]|jgi:hypothetical protein|nr:MAG: hypothetical protein A4E25_01900 [Methanobacterium sp. PtaB.Bin024]
MGYLKCEKCGGYYELQEGESPDDFDVCNCGGKLVYTESIDEKDPSKEIYSESSKIPDTDPLTESDTDFHYDNQRKIYCSQCGFENNAKARFCKKCGFEIKKSKGKIEKFNSKINILAVFVGILVSLIVLFISAMAFSPFLASKQIDMIYFVLLVISCMLFVGGVVTGFLVGGKPSNGYINGGFLTLVTFVNFGTIFGAAWLITIGVSAALSNIFGSSTSSSSESSLGYTNTASSASSLGYDTPSTTNTSVTQSSTNISPDTIVYLLLLVFLIVIVIVAGPLGGMLGAFIRETVRKR